MIGGRAPAGLSERLFSVEFPEAPGALVRFLDVLGTRWNITLFHYRTDGADYGRILCAFEAGAEDAELTEHMDRLDRLGVTVHTGCAVSAITPTGVRWTPAHGTPGSAPRGRASRRRRARPRSTRDRNRGGCRVPRR